MNRAHVKKYLITAIIQIIIITVFVVFNLYAYKIETVVLKPVLYMVPIGIALLCIDIILLVIVFKKGTEADDGGAK